MKNFDKVVKIAKKLRRKADRDTKIQSDYGKTLGGACAIMSLYLWRYLHRQGIRCQVRWSDGHCFVTYGNKIVDITATQFGKKQKVYIADFKNHPECWWQQEPNGQARTIRELDANETEWVSPELGIVESRYPSCLLP